MNLPFVAENLPFASAASVKFHLLFSISTKFLNSKIVFYFVFLLFYCRMYKKKKKVGEYAAMMIMVYSVHFIGKLPFVT